MRKAVTHRRIVITGLGIISSIGIGKNEFWSNLLNGKSGISEVSAFDTANHFTHRGGEVKNFRPEQFINESQIPFLSRATQLAFAAAKLALDDSGINYADKMPASVCLGTTFGSAQAYERIVDSLKNGDNTDEVVSQSFSNVPTNTTPAFIAKALNLNGSNFLFSTACAAGNYAIGYGFDQLVLGRSEIALVGGFDPFIRVAFTGFNQFSAVAPEKCQPFDKERKGMMVAEGAGILLLETLDHALKRDANIYAEIAGYGLSCDAYHMTNPVVDSIAKCMEKAMKSAGIKPEDIDYISAHGTGTRANDRTECAAVKKVFGERYRSIPMSSIKSMIGHTMGAASAIEALACALVVQNDIIPPTINFETADPECDVDCVPNKRREVTVNIALNNSYAFGGNNASLVVKKFH